MRVPRKKATPPKRSPSQSLTGAEAVKEMLESIEALKKRGFNVVGEVMFRKGPKTFSIKADELGRISLRAPLDVENYPSSASFLRKENY
jgi:hypothetical protein